MSYILKDDLKMLWEYADTESAEKFLDSWIERAKETDIRYLKDFAKTVENYKYGLLNHANYPINSGKIEGMNNRSRLLKELPMASMIMSTLSSRLNRVVHSFILNIFGK